MIHETYFWDYTPRKWKYSQRDMCTPIFKAALFTRLAKKFVQVFLWRGKNLNEPFGQPNTVAKTWKHSKCLSTNKWIKKVSYIYIWIYTYIYTRTYMCVCTHIHAYVYVYTHTHMYMHMCVYTHTCICMYMRIHTHSRMLFSMKRRNLAIGTSVVLWKDSEGITICKISQERKDKYCIISLIRGT